MNSDEPWTLTAGEGRGTGGNYGTGVTKGEVYMCEAKGRGERGVRVGAATPATHRTIRVILTVIIIVIVTMTSTLGIQHISSDLVLLI
jgi:hypothetical protein